MVTIQIKSILAKVTMVFSKDGNVHCPLRVQSIIRYYQAIVCFYRLEKSAYRALLSINDSDAMLLLKLKLVSIWIYLKIGCI